MKNPIKIALEELGQTQHEFSIEHNLSFSTMRMAVSGRLTQIPSDIKIALYASEVKIKNLEEEYLRFRVWKAKEDLRRFQKRKARTDGL